MPDDVARISQLLPALRGPAPWPGGSESWPAEAEESVTLTRPELIRLLEAAVQHQTVLIGHRANELKATEISLKGQQLAVAKDSNRITEEASKRNRNAVLSSAVLAAFMVVVVAPAVNAWLTERTSTPAPAASSPSPVAVAASPDHGDDLGPGDDTLRPGERLSSRTGLYQLELTSRGVLLVHDVARGRSSAIGNSLSMVRMQDDCNLVLFAASHVVANSQTEGDGEDCILRMQDDGNVVIIAIGNRPIARLRV